MNTDLTFRFATEKDLPSIIEIYNSAVIEGVTSQSELTSVQSRLQWFRNHNTDTRPIWVASDDINSIVLGWVSLQDFYGEPVYRHTAEISVYVKEETRRQGIATGLINMVLENHNQLGVKTFLGLIYKDNLPSIKLFADLGFVKYGLMPGVAKIKENIKDVVIMGYSVSPK